MTTSILDTMNSLAKVSDAVAKVPMTAPEVAGLKAKLYKENRMNVYPNKFNRAIPYSVRVRQGNEWTSHGNFTSVDVAAAVGTLVSASLFGAKALQGNYDQAVVETHPEFTAWMANEKNADVLRRLSA